MSNSAGGMNNLNIITFIKDIYQSLKHMDVCFSQLKENIDSRLTRLEDNQQMLITKMENIEFLLNKLNESNKESGMLDKNIEFQLLEKMKNLNNTISQDKLELKPQELTIANILENNYSILDINNTILESNLESNLGINAKGIRVNGIDFGGDSSGFRNGMVDGIEPANPETLHSLLF